MNTHWKLANISHHPNCITLNHVRATPKDTSILRIRNQTKSVLASNKTIMTTNTQHIFFGVDNGASLRGRYHKNLHHIVFDRIRALPWEYILATIPQKNGSIPLIPDQENRIYRIHALLPTPTFSIHHVSHHPRWYNINLTLYQCAPITRLYPNRPIGEDPCWWGGLDRH